MQSLVHVGRMNLVELEWMQSIFLPKKLQSNGEKFHLLDTLSHFEDNLENIMAASKDIRQAGKKKSHYYVRAPLSQINRRSIFSPWHCLI